VQNSGASKFHGETGPRWARKTIVAQERTATVIARSDDYHDRWKRCGG
jgi:hypothetical protein